MRRLFVGCALVCFALVARAEEPALELDPEGGFAPRGQEYSIAFHFAEMKTGDRGAHDVPASLNGATVLSPAKEWTGADGAKARLDVCLVLHHGFLSDEWLAAAKLHLDNPAPRPFSTTLAVTITPGNAIHALAFEKHAFLIEGRPVLIAETPSRGAILADSPFAARPLSPQDQAHVESAKGECRGEMIFDLTLAPGQSQTLGFVCPLEHGDRDAKGLDFYRSLSVDDLFAEAEKARSTR
jgi:hypothetical protein